MLRFMDGFDHQNSMLEKGWAAVVGTFSAGNGRYGTRSVRTTNFNLGHVRILDPQPTFIAGAAFRWSANPTAANHNLIRFLDGAALVHIAVTVTSAGLVNILRGATVIATSVATPFSANTWAYVEAKATIDGVNGYAEVRVNGTPVVSFTGNTRNGGNPTADRVSFLLSATSQAATIDLDDVYICDGVGDLPHTDFLGDVKVEIMRPVANGTVIDFMPVNAGANWDAVDDVTPDGDNTYNISGTPGDIDTFVLNDLNTASGFVLGFQHHVFARKDDAGLRHVRPILRLGGQQINGASASLGDSYAYITSIHAINPITEFPYTVEDANALESGYEITS